MRYFVISASVLLLLLSNNALFMLGIQYATTAGSALEKLHPAFYVILAGAAFYPFAPQKYLGTHAVRNVRLPAYFMLSASIIMIMWSIISPNAGGEVSSPVITFFMPALFLLMISKVGDKTLLTIASVIPVFLLVNSLLGIIGSATGFNLLAKVAGSNLANYDPRPTGLLGHPLTNAQITGAFLLYLLQSSIKTNLRRSDLMQIAIHTVALIAFGGRAALVICVLFVVLFAFLHAARDLLTGRSRAVTNVIVLTAASAVALPFALQAGLADVMLERLSDDGGSADTRLSALQMLGTLSPSQWLMGMGPAQRDLMLQILETPQGFESFPIALIASHGLPIMLLVTITTFLALFKLASPIGSTGRWMVFYYFTTAVTSLSLGSKSISLSLFILLIVAVRVIESGRRPTPLMTPQGGAWTTLRAGSEPR